jgi:hypothetical protein
MDESSVEAEEQSLAGGDGGDGDVENTVAFGLVQEALKFNKVS